MKLLPSVFSSLNSRVKIFVFVVISRRHFSIFMWFNEGLEEKNTNSEVIFAVCRLTWDHVTSNLISLIEICTMCQFQHISIRWRLVNFYPDVITCFDVASIPARKMICAAAIAMTRLSRIWHCSCLRFLSWSAENINSHGKAREMKYFIGDATLLRKGTYIKTKYARTVRVSPTSDRPQPI